MSVNEWASEQHHTFLEFSHSDGSIEACDLELAQTSEDGRSG